jgi:smad nuclear-interacting protein 1
LARETNLVKGVQIKYNEPPEARKPLKNWRLYVFKGTEQIGESEISAGLDDNADSVDLIHIYRQSAYLVGRDTVVSHKHSWWSVTTRLTSKVTDIPVAHPSCSKQHAAIQFRQITEKNEYGEQSSSVK